MSQICINSTISPVPLVHGQLRLGVTEPHEAVLLLDTANVDQPAAVQLTLHQRLVPGVGGVREQVLVPLLPTVTSEISQRNTSKTILPHTPNFPILEL